jgi:hypothetical protein
MDVRAFMTRAQFEFVLERNKWTEEMLLSRYEAVILLESSAMTTSLPYTQTEVRAEERATAAELDEACVAAWSHKHQNVRYVPTTVTLEDKCRTTCHVIEEILANALKTPLSKL